MWNAEVKCIDCSNKGQLTKGKIYKIVDGILTTDIGAKYYYKDIDNINRASLVNYFEEVEMGKSKWNGKVRCLKAYNCRYLTEGKVYDVVDGVLTNNLGLKAVYVNLEALNYTKYKIDVEGEYSEEELEVLKSTGIKFKKVGE